MKTLKPARSNKARPSGRYVFCVNTSLDETDTAYVFTIDGVQLQHWTEHHRSGRGDMTIDADGGDVCVSISKADPDKYHIIKRRLDNGAVTDLAPYGNGQHASMRNINRPSWVFVTCDGTFPDTGEYRDTTSFYQEVIALRIDGSGEVRRPVQTHDVKYDYWSETHASPSPDGTQVIWSSNWGVLAVQLQISSPDCRGPSRRRSGHQNTHSSGSCREGMPCSTSDRALVTLDCFLAAFRIPG